MKKLLFTTFIFTILVLSFYLNPGQVPLVYACSGTPSLSVETVRPGPNVFYENQSPIIINDSLNNIGQYVYLTAQGNGCSGNIEYNFESAYWNETTWVVYQGVNIWQTANNVEVPLDEGIRQYSLTGQTRSDSGDNYKEIQLFAMTKTSSVSNITSGSASLSWSLRMNHYPQTSCDATCSNTVKFYLLIGTDPAIVGDRTVASGEIGPINAFQSDYDASTIRITWNVNNHLVTGLNSNTTYYWRIRGDHPSVPDSFFAGGSFTTATILPASTNYRRVFVTSSGYKGDLKAAANSLGRSASTGLAAADNICQYHADSRSLGGNWKAWLSDNTASAGSRLEHASVPYKLLTDLTVANNWSDLITLKGSSYLQNPINVTESTEISVTSNVWTGTNGNGGSANIHCSGWTANPDTNGWAGNTDLINSSWTSSTYITCLHPSLTPRLYCFEQFGLTASPTPSPTPTLTPTPAPAATATPTSVTGSCGISNMSIADGLITSPFLDGQSIRSRDDLFGSKCIIDTKAGFAPFDIPTFDDLKSLYYDQRR